MSQSVTKPKITSLNRRQAEALRLCFLDEMSDQEIAKSLHTSRQTLCRWKAIPEFRRQLDEMHAAALQDVKRDSIAVRSNRISQLIDRSRRMRQLIQARAIDHADVAGGDTGLLVREIKSIGQGDRSQITETYKADTALLREMRETEKQIAIEVGEWSEKAEISGPNGGPIQHRIIEDEREEARELFQSYLDRGINELDARAELIALGIDPADLPRLQEA